MWASIAVEFIPTQTPLSLDISLNSSQYVNHSKLQLPYCESECGHRSLGFVLLEMFSKKNSHWKPES